MKEEKEEKFSPERVAKKFGIELEKLKREQIKLSRNLSLKDTEEISKIERIGGIDCSFFENNIIAAIVVISPDMEILEQQYHFEKLKFPYIPGFRAYRELPAMLAAYEKLEEKPQVIFVNGHGIAHSRLGLASHFSLVAGGVPAIGVAERVLDGEIKDGKIVIGNKIVGEEIKTKTQSNPIYVSPGNLISIKSAVELTKKFVREPHKLPEPLHLAAKYAKKMRDEMRGKES